MAGALDKASGDRVSKYARLQSTIAATETFQQGIQVVHRAGERHLWDWLCFSPEHIDQGMSFDEVSPGVFEQVFVKQQASLQFNAVFSLFPQASEYRTKDTMTRHPQHPHLYRFSGRTDSQEIGLPVTETGLVLPCGATGRWQGE